MGRFVSSYVPELLQKPALRIINGAIRCKAKIFNFGLRYYCPVCRSHLRAFKPLITDQYTRPGAKRCPVCSSLERHRWIWLFLQKRTSLFDATGAKMLHIAPEEELGKLFEKIPNLDYLSGDIASKRAMERIDITSISYPDESFDIIYCSHVLEHVPDDRKAINEFYRVLKQGGWALIVVPMKGEKTFEDMNVADSKERDRVFGHPEHVRICGTDYKDRLTSAGFNVTTFHAADVLTQQETTKYGIDPEPVFLCKK